MQQVTAHGNGLTGLHALAEVGEDIGQMPVCHLVFPVPHRLVDAVRSVRPDGRHGARRHRRQQVMVHREVYPMMEECLSRHRMLLLAVTQRHLHILLCWLLKRHTVAAVRPQYHFFCISHIAVYWLSFHSSVLRLCLCHFLPMRRITASVRQRLRHLGVVPDDQRPQ